MDAKVRGWNVGHISENHRPSIQTPPHLSSMPRQTVDFASTKDTPDLPLQTIMAETAAPAGDVRPPKSVIYCGVCSLPPEVSKYCPSPRVWSQYGTC